MRKLHLQRVMVFLAVMVIAVSASAQVDEEVSFSNKTGLPRNGLQLTYSQPFAPNQPTLSTGGAVVVSPFTTTSYLAPGVVMFSGSTVPDGGRVPTSPNATMRFSGASPDHAMSLMNAVWMQDGIPTHTVVRLRIQNRSGAFADSLLIQLFDHNGLPLTILDVDVSHGFDPRWCLPVISGSPGHTIGLGLNCCISGFEGDVGPIQFTLAGPEPVSGARVEWRSSGDKVGSAEVRNISNDTSFDDLSGPAVALSLETNIPVTQVCRSVSSPLDRIIGLGSTDLFLYGGVVPENRTLKGGMLTVTSSDRGPTNIKILNADWYRPRGGPLPELLYYTFDEASGNQTSNRAFPGVGPQASVATVQGHQLGLVAGLAGGGLRGRGGPSAANAVNTQWSTSLGTGDWTIAVWFDRGVGALPQGMRLFGEPSAGLEAWVNGNDLILSVAGFPIITPQGAAQSAPTMFAWTKKGTTPEIKTYKNGALVSTVIIPQVTLNGSGEFKVGGSGTSSPGLANGVRLDEFRLYNRALTAIEIASTTACTLANDSPEPQWQTNQAMASLSIDGAVGNAFWPADVVRRVGETVTIDISTSLLASVTGVPWQLMVSPIESPMYPAAVSETARLPDGQIQNVSPYSTSLSLPFAPHMGQQWTSTSFVASSAMDVYLQLAVMAPESATGIALSAPVGLHVTSSGSGAILPGPNGDDTTTQVYFAERPLCGPPSLRFAGTTWTSFFVSANGFVSFGSPCTSFSPSAAEFASGPPRLAGMWTDLNPSLGGKVTTTAFENAVVVTWARVPVDSSPSSASSVTLVFDVASESCGIFGFDPAPAHNLDTLVGLSPGGGVALDPGPIDFASRIGQGMFVGAAAAMRYQITYGAAPSGFYSILFPDSDGSRFLVE